MQDELDDLISPEGLAKLCAAASPRFAQECLLNPEVDVVIRANGQAVINIGGVVLRERLHRKGR